MAVDVYGGRFSEAEANRLLWRAGFGPRKGEAAKLAKKGLSRAVSSLLNPPRARLTGPAPKDERGRPIAPKDLWGHDVLWWLDKMVRSNQPLVERMALNWHDWFATGDAGANHSLAQAKLFRKRALGSFEGMIRAITKNRAMLIWLSGIENNKQYPNENYARELMELFTLGVSDGSGYPYTEDDVREQARALTGWRADWRENVGYVNFRFDSNYHDRGSKTIFGQTGNFDWEDSCRLCLEHEAHAPFLVDKLWSYFIPDPIPGDTRQALVDEYRSGYEIKPLLGSILKHPAFYEGSTMVKPPVVLIAGLLRGRGRFVDEESWAWISELAGQRLFRPPNVSGWDETRWLDTSSFRGRWIAASNITSDNPIDIERYSERETPSQAISKALRYWGRPLIGDTTRAELIAFGKAVEDSIDADWQKSQYRGLRQSALRMLIATSPDMQSC